jgi:hypothetical protein
MYHNPRLCLQRLGVLFRLVLWGVLRLVCLLLVNFAMISADAQ